MTRHAAGGLPVPGLRPPAPTPLAPPDRLIGAGPSRRRAAPVASRIVRRRRLVSLTKWLLPLFALLLLGAVAAWPELTRVGESGRVAFRRAFSVEPESGRMLQARYRGVDERGRPYTVTAASAQQNTAETVDLVEPKGDIVLENGTWTMVEARKGVFVQHRSLMDLSGDVVLYREDGTRLLTDSAALDLKSGAAASNELTRAEGPFGVLDAAGFTLTDKGGVIQFPGPAHLVLNEADKR